MKYLVLTILLSGSALAETKSNEFLAGSLTYHFFTTQKVTNKFNNKVTSDGSIISNPMLAFRQTEVKDSEYTAMTYFGGENSIGEAMGGAFISGGTVYGHFKAGMIFGAYAQNYHKFVDRDIVTPSTPFFLDIGFLPVVGIETSLDVNFSKNTYGILYTVVAPMFITSAIGIGIHL